MKIILLAIVMCCTSFTVVKKKLWLCSTIISFPNKQLHAPRVIAAKDFNEARTRYLRHLMYECNNLKGGIINTKEECLAIDEITEDLIIN